ncbi:decapping and exoribonuclease protein-like [Anoplolepis gracilipes]|uniref:decapping and exoribonuclease protein-like n=1 Tax=Anoplolepis gracilipes TaxID=354296 RepID=UPI003BA0AA83
MSFKIDCQSFSEYMLPILTVELIGHYSIDGDLKYCDDLSQLKYYVPPQDFDNVFFDLNKNFMSTRYKPTSHVKLQDVLTWVSNNFNLLEKPLSQEGQWLNTDFICRRGALKTLLSTPYKKRNEDWIICASKYRGSIYLCEFYTDEKEFRHVNATAKERQLCSQGFKFEQYMVADHPSHRPNSSVSLNECEKFHCMIKANFDDHSLLYEAEIDGISSHQPITDTLVGKTFELIELKTLSAKLYHEIGTPQYDKYGTIPFEKAILWWCQNYLAGIKGVICGIKNSCGEVKMIKEFSTDNLLQLSKFYDGNVDKCKMFCKIFLDNVKKIVIKDYNECMYKFYYDASNDIINYSEEASDNEMCFLKSWFVEKARDYNSTFQ